eukprot:198750-Amphidinium_carterae.1
MTKGFGFAALAREVGGFDSPSVLKDVFCYARIWWEPFAGCILAQASRHQWVEHSTFCASLSSGTRGCTGRCSANTLRPAPNWHRPPCRLLHPTPLESGTHPPSKPERA